MRKLTSEHLLKRRGVFWLTQELSLRRLTLQDEVESRLLLLGVRDLGKAVETLNGVKLNARASFEQLQVLLCRLKVAAHETAGLSDKIELLVLKEAVIPAK